MGLGQAGRFADYPVSILYHLAGSIYCTVYSRSRSTELAGSTVLVFILGILVHWAEADILGGSYETVNALNYNH